MKDGLMPEMYDEKMIKLSRPLGILTLVVTVVYLFLLFYVDVGASTTPLEIYLRVMSSVAAMLVLSLFFETFYCYHTDMNENAKRLKAVSIGLSVAGFIKVAISLYYLLFCIAHRNLIMFFYVGEILVWATVAIYSFLYYKHLK